VHARSRSHSAAALAGFLLAAFAVSAVGGTATGTSIDSWYPTLAKPAFNPPSWVFAPVWTVLYVAIAVAGWRVWRKIGFSDRRAFAAYALQLVLNMLWPILFFGLRALGAAFVELLLLWASVAVTLVLFWKHDRIAGLLFVPYLAWVSFAGALNAAIWRLN
jgi:tryptophan-rich sensory protein